MGVTTVVKTVSGTALLVNGVLLDPSSGVTVGAGGVDSITPGATLNIGTVNAGAINVGNATNTSTVIVTAPSYSMFFTPSFYLNAAADASGGTPLVNSPNIILRGKYFSGGTSNNIDSYFQNQVTNAVGPASQVNLIVQGVSYVFQSNGNLLVPAGCDFDTSTSGQLNIGITNATGISVGYIQTTQTLLQSKNITLKGADAANGATPVATDTINAYTGNTAIVSFRNAGSQKAAIDASGSIYMTAGQQLDTLVAGTLGIGLSNANNVIIGHNNGGPIQLNYGGTGGVVLTQGAGSGTPGTAFTLSGGAHTTLTASAEYTDFYLNLNRVVQFNTGAIATVRAVRFDAPAYAFVGASTITTAATVAINGAPVQGTNATITNSYAFWVQAGGVNLGQATVTQATSITTGVTVNGASGIITTVSSTLAAATAATFTVTNSAVKTGSVVSLTMSYQGTVGSTTLPQAYVGAVSAGSFTVTIYNAGSVALANTMKIHFTVT